MAINYVLQKCNNEKSDNYGQYVARVRTLGTTTTEDVAEKIQKNASVKRSDVKAVLDELADVLTEKLADGFTVKLDGLGTFSPRIRAKYQAVTDENPYDVEENVKNVGVLFRPERKKTNGGTVQTLMPERKLKKYENYVQQSNATPEP
ncbi:MAG: HU family DNA-binding protein [Prevotella sp.]|nr:HU family DNA-binding protein [Prevotella sp.]